MIKELFFFKQIVEKKKSSKHINMQTYDLMNFSSNMKQ